MKSLKKNKESLRSPAPVFGIENSSESFVESGQDRYLRTAECAYYKAQERGFEPGHELDDWLEAEAEL